MISTDPINNAVAVMFDKTISATFNMAMNPSTLNGTTFKVSQGVNAVAGAISYTGPTVSFVPTNPLLANKNTVTYSTHGTLDTV